ncbi:hypothetical protein, partial [Mycobacterium shinjukuense]
MSNPRDPTLENPDLTPIPQQYDEINAWINLPPSDAPSDPGLDWKMIHRIFPTRRGRGKSPDGSEDRQIGSDEPVTEESSSSFATESSEEWAEGQAQPDEGQVQTDGESNDGKAEVEPDE